MRQKQTNDRPDNQSRYHMRLPGFVIDSEIGLGDVVKRMTSTVGIRPCGGCQRRAATLNSWFTFGPGRQSKARS